MKLVQAEKAYVFYNGSWDYQRKKGTKVIVSESSDIKTTCEVYSGQDVHFVTITGQKLQIEVSSQSLISPALPSYEDLADKMAKKYLIAKEKSRKRHKIYVRRKMASGINRLLLISM